MRFGAHLSIQGGWPQVAARAVQLECETLQVFSRSPRGGQARVLVEAEVAEFWRVCAGGHITPISVHVPYFVNLASADDAKWEYSVEVLRQDLQRASVLGATYVVTHPGQSGVDRDQGLERAARAVSRALEDSPAGVMLLLETTAGQGRELGWVFSELRRIATVAQSGSRLGFCLDTSHAFAAGYDLSSNTGLEECLDGMEEWLGLERLHLIHLNDSVYPLGSRRDRHAHIGQGLIGLEGFWRLVNHPALEHLAGVLETPVSSDCHYATDLETLKRIRSQS
ncbi:MAG: deoxyribonuclease IV [Bacillota bacterium]